MKRSERRELSAMAVTGYFAHKRLERAFGAPEKPVRKTPAAGATPSKAVKRAK